MIARWHLDLLALSVAVGLVAVVVEARANRRARSGTDDAAEGPRGEGNPRDPAPSGRSVDPTNDAAQSPARDGGSAETIGVFDGGAVRIPPAAAVGIALLLAGVFDMVAVPAFAMLTVVAGFIGCRRPAVTVIVAALFLATPAVEGFPLPTWLLVLLAVVLLALVPTAHPATFRLPGRIGETDRVDETSHVDESDRTGETDPLGKTGRPGEPGRIGRIAEPSSIVPLLVAAALWTAAPDTELPLAAAGALLAPALRDLLGRRDLRPDAPALMAVTVAATIGFAGRPAGAVVLALVAPIAWIATGPTTRSRITATAVSIAALVAACRTGGLRQHVDRALVPTIAAGVLALVVLVALLLTERVRSTDPPAGHQQP